MRQVLIPADLDSARRTRAAPDDAVHSLGGETMGTSWSVKLCAPNDRSLAALQRELKAELAEIVRQMSPWDSSSCLSLLNDAPPGSWHDLPRDFFTVLEYSVSVARMTDGAFDPTIGALIDCWGFGPPHLRQSAPSPPLRPGCDWTAVQLDPATRRALQPGGIRYDLCAVAKGYAVDRLSGILEGNGIRSYLVEIGGELRGAGVKPDGSPWWVAIEHDARRPPIGTLIALHGLSVATSGGRWRYLDTSVGRRTHLIDPRRGTPLSDTFCSVSVIASECMHADAWATALAVSGPEDGLRMATHHGIAALFTFGGAKGRDRLLSPPMAEMLS